MSSGQDKGSTKSTSVKLKTTKASTPRKRRFFIGGHNGVALIEKPLLLLGMSRTDNDKDFFLKWVELKKQINYSTFRPGDQMVNHIPSINCLTTKTGLLETLREYQRCLARSKLSASKLSFNLSSFFMETFKLDSERQQFLDTFKADEIWIVKPSGKNQGKGIYLINDPKQIIETSKQEQNGINFRRNTNDIVQKYIMNPLLIHGYKFDIRVYMLIASTQPYIVLYHHGYLRLSCVKYSNDTLDLSTHLTNQYVQKKHPLYSEKKEDTVMSFEQFNEYINIHEKEKTLCDDWVYNDFTVTMKEIMLTCFHACKHKLEQKQGMFELLGFDFMIDDAMKVWLIEVNINPALHTNCQVLREVIPPMAEETINLVVEIFDKHYTKEKLRKLENRKTFQTLYNAASSYQFKFRKQKSLKSDEVEEAASSCEEHVIP